MDECPTCGIGPVVVVNIDRRLSREQREERTLCLLIAGVYAAGDYDETAAHWVDMALAVGQAGGERE